MVSGTERIKIEVREWCKAVAGLGREELSRKDTCIFMHKHTASSVLHCLHCSLVSGSAQQKITNEILTLKMKLYLTLFYNICWYEQRCTVTRDRDWNCKCVWCWGEEPHTHPPTHNVSISGEMMLHFKLIIRECLLGQRAFSSHGDLKVKETIYKLRFHPSSAQVDNIRMKMTF